MHRRVKSHHVKCELSQADKNISQTRRRRKKIAHAHTRAAILNSALPAPAARSSHRGAPGAGAARCPWCRGDASPGLLLQLLLLLLVVRPLSAAQLPIHHH